MKKKLSVRVLCSLILTLVFFCMPMGAFVVNNSNTMSARAEEIGDTGESTEETLEATKEMTEDATIKDTQDVVEGDTEESGEIMEDSTISGNEVPTPECSCDDKCQYYSVDRECEVCSEDYSLCEYVAPNIKITISTPQGWHNSTAKVPVSVEDIAASGNFTIKSIQAKIGQNGSWRDITEDRNIEISENCTLYVLVTDQKGKTYERNRYVKCFDFTKPVLNAAVSNGLLSIKAQDTDSGIKTVYVNGYEFQEFTNGVLNIRLQQFDSGYPYFTIQAMDHAGNMSDVYKTANPYYRDSKTEDGTKENPAKQLPVNATPTAPSSATGKVTEHTKTDNKGNTVSETTSLAEQKKAAMKEAAKTEQEETTKSETGKEFYTIQTKTDKVFYLIIDREGEEEMVYFLTEITENDLLNVTEDNKEVLPQNSAALESAIPVSGEALANNKVDQEVTESERTEESTEEVEETPVAEENSLGTYLVLGIFGGIAIGAGYYFKVVKGKKEDFLDEDDEEEEEEEIVEEEDVDEENNEFF